ncbi:MAG: CoA pyrophosphatase [Thermodesulforhabdaceae bacterium]
MEEMREVKTWSVNNVQHLFETISSVLYKDLSWETFGEISDYLLNPQGKDCEITAVLFLICSDPKRRKKMELEGVNEELGIILNKRSRYVVQPGDLCFPGGGIKRPLDNIIARFLMVFHDSLSKYPLKIRKAISLLAVTALREAWEEIRLNPFKVKVCGVLSPYRLVMFRKVIVPVVGVISASSVMMMENSYEVEKILWIPFSELLDPSRYARYRLYNYPKRLDAGVNIHYQDFLCFIHQDGVATEILWGATFRMVMDFIGKFFDFLPPPAEELPVVPGILSDAYLGRRR